MPASKCILRVDKEVGVVTILSVRDRYKDTKSNDPTIRVQFDTYRF